MSGGKQSVSTVQAALQALLAPLQTYGAQLSVVGCWQLPLPSQVRPVVSVEPVPGQEGGWQEVPPAYLRQAPLPSQNPSWPQVACP